MKSLTLKIIAWIILWVATWIIFIDYLPRHVHFEYMGLVSPFVLLTLPFYGSGISPSAWSLVIIPGVIFWSIIGGIVFLHYRTRVRKD